MLATFGRLFIQVRRGQLTPEAIERATAAAVRHRTAIPRGTLQGLLILTEPGAAIPTEAVRARQKAFMADALKRPDIRVAVVIFGEDVGASLLRSASRSVAPSQPQVRVLEQPKAACEWLSAELGLKLEDVTSALTEARALAAREIKSGR